MPLLATVPVHRVMAPPRLVLRMGMSFEEARLAMDGVRVPGAPVVDEEGSFKGVVSRTGLADTEIEATLSKAPISDEWAPVTADDHLDSVIDVLTSSHSNWSPVVDPENHVVGIVSMPSLIAGYKQALSESLKRLVNVRRNVTLLEEEVREGSELAGVRISAAPLPPGTVALSLVRRGQLMFPHADTTLEPGDRVTLVSSTSHAREVQMLLRGAGAATAEEGEDEGAAPWSSGPS
ncbi:MAG: CBS domain-containing protein [Actinomycetota bacterium]